MDAEERPPRDDIDEDTIRQRAYEISQRGGGGSSENHWEQAERELRDERRIAPPEEAPTP